MKKSSLIAFIILWGLYFPQSIYAQTPACGTDQAMQELYKNNPQSKEKAKNFEMATARYIRQMKASRNEARTQYTIPVVFHVFGTNFLGATVNDQIIITALEKVNEDFQGLNDDFQSVSALFSPVKSTLDISFKLAKIDPNGNLTTGINYYPERAGFGNGGGYDAQIQQYAWDNYKYMNVYIMLDLYNDGVTNNSGVAWYPNQYMSDNNLARVVYNGRYLYGNTDKEFASVLTHEFGHWLNLAHTFDNGCDTPGDNVADTPPTTANTGTCNFTTEKCPGAGIPNGENYMDYTSCHKMFTQDQVDRMKAALQHTTRFPIWQSENLTATGVDLNAPFISYSNSILIEDEFNSGGIETVINLKAENGASFAVRGQLQEGVHFRSSGIPAGLSATITISDAQTGTFALTGKAQSHATTNSSSNISITFLDAAISGGVSNLYTPTRSKISIDFQDPYKIVYGNPDDMTASSSSVWNYFTLNTGNGAFGVWFDNGNLRFETYKKALICEGNTRNVSLLTYGTSINKSQNWVKGGAYPDEHDIRTPSYTTWDGKSGYFGFQFNNNQNRTLHGWFRISVTADGTAYTLFDYAYQEDPNGTIRAGYMDDGNNNQAPVSDFSANKKSITSGETVTFTDLSANNPTRWEWSFQGGLPATSTTQSPTVTYTAPGSYAVTLKASNDFGEDSITKQGFIIVSDLPSGEYCMVTNGAPSGQYIKQVIFNTINNNTSYDNNGYSNFTNQSTTIKKGNAYTLSVSPHQTWDKTAAKVWVDWNQDGDFNDSGEEVLSRTGKGGPYISNVTIPDNAISGSTRMRIRTVYNAPVAPCKDQHFSEVEDYTLIIEGADNPNINYCTSENDMSAGQYIKNVTFGSINNSSTHENGGYSYYDNQSASFTQGSSYTLSIKPHVTWDKTAAEAWIDWNQDGDFDDSNESVLSESGNKGTYTINVVIPQNASLGTTRLRVRTVYDRPVNACGNEYFGETEDYAINIQNALASSRRIDTEENQVNLYPNPTSDFFYIEKVWLSSKGITNGQVAIYTTKGEMVFYKKLSALEANDQTIMINMKQLPAGLYQLQIVTADKVLGARIILK